MPHLDDETLASIAYVCIHPSIGISRVGNSEEWFYGPEIPGRIDTPDGGFKDANGAIKRQAARFRLYGFNDDDEAVCELNDANGFELDWSFELGNQKAAWYVFQSRNDPTAWKEGYASLRNPTVQPGIPPEERSDLYIKSGVNNLKGLNSAGLPLQGQFTGSSKKTHDIYLGEALTDEQGRLVILPGHGNSRSYLEDDKPYPLITNDFDSPDWVDDTSDGWITVTATLTSDEGTTFTPAHKARVIGTTPKFATEVYAPTSLYDVMEDIYEADDRKNPDYLKNLEVDWYEHIWPLLQRPPRLSWVNGQANNGHGLPGPGNFFEPKWQKALSDNSAASEPIRQGVLGRMRLPVDTDLTQARAGQAYPYFMPWLSGDSGRATSGQSDTFASLTQLQYDRLTKWANGEFTVKEPPPVYTTFEEIPIDLQPEALTKASLEPTIGAPLFPGIEMSWNAELPSTYALDTRFTIADDLLPGDLTKYLSLPWQSDFYMCRSYWWPSARPDAIVTAGDYAQWYEETQDVAPSLRPTVAMKRVPWERGLRVNYTDTYEDQPLFANTDMVQFWHQLGFVVKAQDQFSEDSLPVYVEQERGNVHNESTVAAPRSQVPSNPSSLFPHAKGAPHWTPFLPGAGKDRIETIDSLRKHLQSAMAVELSTIPLYLFAMYSVKTPEEFKNDPRYVDPVMKAIKGVVNEEMLHLSLAGNILKAVGGTPRLYHPSLVPRYPGYMLHRVPLLPLKLRPLTKGHLDTFISVELPQHEGAPAQADNYNTLGQFYAAIKDGLTYLNAQHTDLFHPETKNFQFSPAFGYQARIRDAGGAVIVTDLATAVTAIDTIVDQGEGNPGPYVDLDHLEKDHYAVFQELQQSSDIEWTSYPTFPEPTTAKYYKLDPRIYQVSRTFDAAYCFLLLTIERLWTIEADDARKSLILGNMFTVMLGVLSPLSIFLVQQPIGDKGKVAAPCFNYYDFGEEPALAQLLAEMQTAIDAYLDVTEETADQVVVNNYGAQIEALLGIQNTMSTLLDLGDFKKIASPVVKKSIPGISDRGAKGFGPVVL